MEPLIHDGCYSFGPGGCSAPVWPDPVFFPTLEDRLWPFAPPTFTNTHNPPGTLTVSGSRLRLAPSSFS